MTGCFHGYPETTPLVRERPDAEVEVAQPRPGKRFLHAISPVDIGEWRSTGVMFRILAVIKVPVLDYIWIWLLVSMNGCIMFMLGLKI